jgi:imidazolonepropionase
MSKEVLLFNIARLLTMEPGEDRVGPLGVIEDACVRIRGDRIAWVGKKSDFEAKITDEEVIDLKGDVVLPGLIDCHTHLVYAGSRENEFRMRSAGMSYQEIAKSGGGILSTVRATRKASEEELLALAKVRADEFLSRGITTVEIKSGYGLDQESEEKMLKVATRLDAEHAIDVVPTFLGAHVVPEEYKNKRNEYVRLVIDEMMSKLAKAKLCRFCDVFVEEGAFTIDEAREISEVAKSNGLKMKLQVDQFGDGGGGRLAAELEAISADHLDFVCDDGIQAMAKAGVIAVVLPAAAIFVKSGRLAPARKMVDEGVRVAISTDYNPGSSPTSDLFLCATMAVTQMGLTVDEGLLGITKNAAASLGLEKEIGSIAKGKKADLVSFGIPNEDYLLYRFGTNFARKVIKGGDVIYSRDPIYFRNFQNK